MPDALLAQLEELYRGEYRRFLRVAVAVLRDEERAVDAVQEAFASAVQKRSKFRGERVVQRSPVLFKLPAG